MPEAELRSEEPMKEEEKPVTEGEEERVLEINRMSGSLIRKEAINGEIKVSQSVRTKVRKIRSQKEVVKKLPDEEDRKSRKRKGRLGSGALGPHSDPNTEVPLKSVSGIKHNTVQTFKNILSDKITGVRTVKSIVME